MLALALASGQSIGDAADQFGVCRRTLERWLVRPAFRRRVARFRAQMVARALGRMSENMTRAADAVASLLDSPEPHLRLRAARVLFTFGQRLHETVDLDDRIDELEREITRKQEKAP